MRDRASRTTLEPSRRGRQKLHEITVAANDVKTQFFSMGSRDVLVCVLALLSVACYLIARNEARNQGTTFLASWMWQLMAAMAVVPFFLGMGPKMQVLSEVRRRRKNQRERARSLSPAKDYTARQRSRLSSLPHLQLQFIPKFILSGAESEPSSPIDLSQVSPKGFKRRLWERLHFQGNKHEWFSRTKFAGCLREEELDALFEACTWRSVSAGEAIFLKGDSTASGLVMVVDGTLGVYGVMDDAARGDAQRKSLPRRSSGSAVDGEGEAGAVESGQPGEARELLHYELIPGESIGDIDLLYARHSRSFTDDFYKFCLANPAALLLFLRLAVGRLHRVANFMVSEFLALGMNRGGWQPDYIQLHRRSPGDGSWGAGEEARDGSAGEVPPSEGLGTRDGKPDECARLYASETAWVDEDLFHARATPGGGDAGGDRGVFAGLVNELDAGTRLFVHGDTPKAFWVVLSGQVQLFAGGGRGRESGTPPRAELVQGPCVLGAREFLTAIEGRSTTAVVRARSRIARFDMEALMQLAERGPASHVVDLMLLAAQGMFPAIKRFTMLGLSRHWANVGDAVFKEGDVVAAGLYVLITGRVKLKSRASETETELGRGDMLGEESLLTWTSARSCRQRRATAVCMRDCELVRISPQNFELICAQHPAVALKLMQSIAGRLSPGRGVSHALPESGERIAGHSITANLATLAVVPVNADSVAAASALVRRLAEELRKFGAVLTLELATIERVLGAETVTRMHLPFFRTRVASWIVQQEEDYRFVLLSADLANEAWAAVCVSQADSVLLAASLHSHPALSDVEKRCVWNGEEGRVRFVDEGHGDAPLESELDNDVSRRDHPLILDVRRELVLLHPGTGGPGSPPRRRGAPRPLPTSARASLSTTTVLPTP